jgi:chemotaxis family two-component system response regulator Rcp1
MKAVPAILLVEDNPADAEIARRALRDTGRPVELFVVRDGQEALDYLLRPGRPAGGTWRRPDLILLDLNMPRLNGLDVLRQIRAHAELRTVPVLVLTTSGRPEDVRQTYAAGANTYIEKPHDFARFVEVLQTIQHYWLDTARLSPGPDGS